MIMILGPCSKLNGPNLLLTSSGCIERVTQFKLLGVFIDSTLSWNAHIDYIMKKAAKRLYFVLPPYISDKIESIQKRAIRIIFSVMRGMSYKFALSYAELPSLQQRRQTLAKELCRNL